MKERRLKMLRLSTRKTKVSKAFTPKLDPFILSAVMIVGVDEERNLVKLRDNQFLGAIRIEGIDVQSLKDTDKANVYASYARAEKTYKGSKKTVFTSIRHAYVDQKQRLIERLEKEKTPYRKYLIEREIKWLEDFEVNQRHQVAYMLFFGNDPEILLEEIHNYKDQLTRARNTVRLCHYSECAIPVKALLQGGDLKW